MRRRIFRMSRSAKQWNKDWISGCIRVAIFIALRDQKYRPPEEVVVLGIETAYERVRADHIPHSHQPCSFHCAQLPRRGELLIGNVVLNERDRRPETGHCRLLRCSDQAIAMPV